MNHSDQTKQITAQTEKMLIDQYERLYRLPDGDSGGQKAAADGKTGELS